jgi:hypothetical protein
MTMTNSRLKTFKRTHMKKGLMLAVALAATVSGACSADRLTLPNDNTATQDAAQGAPGALQLQVTGIFRQMRGGLGNYFSATGRFGRESYIYTPNEGRNTSHFLQGLVGENRLDPSGFANGVWGGHYGNIRDIYVTRKAIDAAPATLLTDTQKSAVTGMLRTIEALELLYVIATHDSLGAVTEIMDDPQDLAPFVSRDSVYNYILNTLDAAHAQLLAGGATFPVTLHDGFSLGTNVFDTPTTFAQFNRAITARAAAYHATLGGGGIAAWNRAATAMTGSFLNRLATTRTEFDAGVYHVFSLSTGDAANGLDSTSNANYLGHPTLDDDAQLQVGGVLRDARYLAKVFTLATPRNAPQALGIATDQGLRVYRNQSAPMAIVRNEELMLLDAEIRLATGDKTGALANINQVRQNSGVLPAHPTLTAVSPDADFVTAILLEKRYSLLGEGHRWVDHKRYGRLALLPLDLASHFVARVIPVPQAECLVRAEVTDPALAGPGC